jgi:neutral ceramidase
MNEFKAGASMTDITPDLPVNLGGMFLSFATYKVRDKLYSSAVSFCNGENTVIIISCDMVIVTEETTAKVRAAVSKLTGVKPLNIMLCATHTHNAPYAGISSIYLTEKEVSDGQEVLDGIIQKIIVSAVDAFDKMKPAKMGYGSGNAERCCFNRRYIMTNGRSSMQPRGVDNPDRLMVEGPADDQAQVVWLEDAEGEIITVLVNLSSHPAMQYGQEHVSADFPGVMRKVLWKALEKEIPILYLQGACGNVITLDFENDDEWGSRDDGYKHIGRILAGEVFKLLYQSRTKEVSDLSVENKIIQIPYRKFSEEETKEALQLIKDAKASENFKEYVYSKFNNVAEKAWLNTFYQITEADKGNTNCSVEISAVKIGDVYIVTNPAELFVEYQLELKERYKDQKVIMAEISNGWCNYVPTRQAIALGGYETMQRKLTPYAGKMITDTSAELINRLAKETK